MRLQQTLEVSEVPSPRQWLIDDYVQYVIQGGIVHFNGLIIGRKDMCPPPTVASEGV